MSRRNPSSRSASSQKMEEKVCISFSSCSRPQKGLYSSIHHMKPILLANDLHQVLKPKKTGTWDATNIAKRRVKQHPIRHCLSRFFTSDDDLQYNAHCISYSTLCSGTFQRKICEYAKSVQYRTVLVCISREKMSCPGTAIGRIGAAGSAVQCVCT